MAIPRAIPRGRVKLSSKQSMNLDINPYWRHGYGYTGSRDAEEAASKMGKKKLKKINQKLYKFYTKQSGRKP